MSVQFISAKEAVAHIKNNDTVAVDGFIGAVVPEEILQAIEERFVSTGEPKNLTFVYAAGVGDGKNRGMNHVAREGLVSRVIGGHWGLAPKMVQLAVDNKIEAYNLPQGVISHMFRDIASKRPATVSRVGLGTFVDPELQGGKINDITKKDIVSKINILGQECLCFELFPIDVAIVRGTYADKMGNISLDKEALTVEVLSVAMAAKNSGGIVIVQVESVVENGAIDPKMVKIPGIFVDYVVVAEKPEDHMQTFAEVYNPSFVKNNPDLEIPFTPIPLDERKIIARRCAMLLNRSMSNINYGIGMPEGIASVLHEENQEMYFTPSVEPGAIGGTPLGGLNFGASLSPQAIIDQPYQFDFYDGGGLDMAFLGLAQCDQFGNINVSKFGPKIAGCGGFINITQNAKEVVFCGTFTAGGLKVAIDNGKLQIIQEGRNKKFLQHVEQITFSGKNALLANKKVTYVTERAVFVLVEQGLMLVEIADGIDLEKQILGQMEFKPIIADDLKIMDVKLFYEEKMDLKF